jgi:hypothetical protein
MLLHSACLLWLAMANGAAADGTRHLRCCRGHGGPHDAGSYNSRSWETGFFVSQGGSWASEYGDFFLSWYSGLLVSHANRVLGAAAEVLNRKGRPRVFNASQEVGRRC